MGLFRQSGDGKWYLRIVNEVPKIYQAFTCVALRPVALQPLKQSKNQRTKKINALSSRLSPALVLGQLVCSTMQVLPGLCNPTVRRGHATTADASAFLSCSVGPRLPS